MLQYNALFLFLLLFLFFSGENINIFQGITRGRIASNPQGGDIFGWDPIFVPTDHDESNQLSYAEMDKNLKNQISHRGKALKLLEAYLIGKK